MKPAPFSYHAPQTVDEAVALLAELAPDDGRVLAGGQSLVPTMAFRLARPKHLVDINGVAGLDRLEVEDGRLFIGATVRHAAFETPVGGGAARPAAVRRRAQHRASADPHPRHVLRLHRACRSGLRMVRARGLPRRRDDGDLDPRRRLIMAPDFFKGMMTTALDEDELLAEVRLPMLRADVRVGFAEFSRRAGDFAIAMAVVVFRCRRTARSPTRASRSAAPSRSRAASSRRSTP